MNSIPRTIAAASLAALTCTAVVPALAEVAAVYSRNVQADFDSVRFGVESAIVDRGYVIDYHARVGEMLDRTAADVGADESPYRHAETWQFCSATLSRRMMEADPANVAFCPYVVFAYEMRTDPGTVFVGFRELRAQAGEDSSGALAAVDRELAEIVDEAIE